MSLPLRLWLGGLLGVLLACRPAPSKSPELARPSQRALQAGMVVELHPSASRRFGLPYPPSLEAIERLGFDHIVIPLAFELPAAGYPIRRGAPSDAEVLVIAADARSRGLGVVLMPLLSVVGSPGLWRGQLAPRNEARFWGEYVAAIRAAAELAERAGAVRLYVGSEMNRLAGGRRRHRWCEVAAAARRRFPEGELAYAFHHAALARRDPAGCVDVVGVNAWFPLSSDADAEVEALRRGFEGRLPEMADLYEEVSRPLVISELGYPSVDGGAVRPWQDRQGGFLDLEEQRRAYAASLTVLLQVPWISGVTIWSAFGPGGRFDRGFSPLGKPAEKVLERVLFDRIGE
ncbi:MAG: hypothetical protein AAFZ18_03355 [Myxococcota bacterium]